MPRSNSRIPLVRTTCWASNAIIGTFASSQNPKPLNDLSSSVTVAAKSLAGHRGVRPFLEGHTFTWLTFDEAGNTLPEEGSHGYCWMSNLSAGTLKSQLCHHRHLCKPSEP